MTETIRVADPAQLPSIVPKMLGFHPTNSLVIVGLGGAPTARIDLPQPHQIDITAISLAPACRHWQAGALVVLYTPDAGLGADVYAALDRLLPGVPVFDVLRIDNGRMYRPGDVTDVGVVFELTSTGTHLDAVQVAEAREVLEAEAADVTDAEVAESMALASYQVGQGARAWAFHDRALALRGYRSEAMATLAMALTTAQPPPG